jgi:universal stress protein A
MSLYKHVLVATDLTDENNLVLKKAEKLAAQFNATLALIHVVEPLPGYGYAYVGIADIEGQLIEEAKQAILKIGKKYHVASENCHVAVGPTKLEIMDLVEREKVDLIVLGSHGRHGFAELLGSTAHAVVHGSPCDVMTVRIKK